MSVPPKSGPSPRAALYACAAVVACTALAIALDHGIQVGRENHAGMLPVVRRILDPGYLPGDFGIAIRAHHHRVFAWVVAMLASAGLGENGALALLTVVGYATLFAGLWTLGAAVGLQRERRLLLGVLLACGALFLDHGVEANRLLGNGPIMPPTFAHAFLLFSLAAIVRGRWNAALAWAGAVLLIHLQIGAIWLLVLLAALLRDGAWRRPRAWAPGVVALLALCSPALLDLLALAREGLTQDIGALDDVALRMPQHFTFNGGRVLAVLLYLALLLWLVRRWRMRGDARARRFAPLAWVAAVLMALTALHYLDYYLLHTGWIARIQLLRLSLLVPVLGAMAAIAAIPAAGATQAAAGQRRWIFAACALCTALVLANLYRKHEPPALRIVDAAQGGDPWADVCRWVRARGPAGLYVTPPGQTGFTAFAGRSTLVEFKINPDGGAGLAEWSRRLRAVSGGALPRASTRGDAARALDRSYAALPADAFAALVHRYGIGTAVVPLDSGAPGRELYRNAGYRVVVLDAARNRTRTSAPTATRDPQRAPGIGRDPQRR